MFVTDCYCSSSSIIFSSLASILCFCTLQNSSVPRASFWPTLSFIMGFLCQSSPETWVPWQSPTAVDSITLLPYCISHGIVSPYMFTVSSQELVAKWLCKQVWSLCCSHVKICAGTLPRRLVIPLSFWKVPWESLHAMHRETSNFKRLVFNISFEVE